MDASFASAIFPNQRVSRQAPMWLAPLLVGLGAYAVAAATAVSLLNDGDTLTHIVIGRWIIEHRAIPFHDLFTYTVQGGAWVPHEWLAEIAFAAAYDWLGWGGVVAGTALAIAAAFALFARALQGSLGPRRAAIGTALAFLLTESHLLARPHVLALPLLVIWMSAVIRARDEGRTPSFALLPVMTLWCNLHGGFVVGLLFAGLLAAEAGLEAPVSARWQAVRGWGVFLALSTLAALISPNGIELFRLPLRMLAMTFATSTLSEWHAADFQGFEPLEVWIVLAILGGFSLGLKLPWTRTAMLLLLLHLALTHVRNKELLGIIGLLLIAAPLSVQLRSGMQAGARSAARGAPSWFAPRPLAAAVVVAVMIALGVVSTAVALDRRGIRPRENVAPVAAVDAARAAELNGPVLNSIRFGGYLSFVGIPTFIDGRADLFGDAFLARDAAAMSGIGSALPDLLDENGVAWTLLEPSTPAVGLIDHLPGWERVYADPYAVIHRKKMPVSEATRRNRSDNK
jgi:fluoride ion exporter CrcB/FEX